MYQTLMAEKEIDIEEIFDQFEDLRVVVVGDVMLDKYFWGTVDRISPEAPVPVVRVNQKESRLGGAANVALNCKQLGAHVTIASVIGNDADGIVLRDMLKNAGIGTELLHNSEHRPTTTKSRIISRNQQMIRLDEEVTEELNIKEEHHFIDTTLRFLQIEKPHLVIFEDYNKGVLKQNIIDKIIAHCKNIGITTAVDPKFANFLNYKEVDIFKPNLKEVKEGLGIDVDVLNEKTLFDVHLRLSEEINHKVTLLTLSEHGMYYHDNTQGALIPTMVRSVSDVSGAGDTVIAVAAMVYELTRDVSVMAQWSNLAGGLVCEEAGVVPISREVFLKELQQKF
ncbi:Bifunctional protein HldE [compost metagenome]